MPIFVIKIHWQLEQKRLPDYYRDTFWWETLDHGLSVAATWQKPSIQSACRRSRAFLALTHLDLVGNKQLLPGQIHLRTRSRGALMGFLLIYWRNEELELHATARSHHICQCLQCGSWLVSDSNKTHFKNGELLQPDQPRRQSPSKTSCCILL